MSQRQKAIIGAIGAAGLVGLISGCSHSAGDAAVAAPPAPIVDARTQGEIAKHMAAAQFDAQQRAAGMARARAASPK